MRRALLYLACCRVLKLLVGPSAGAAMEDKVEIVVLRSYVAHYNTERPHRGLQPRLPVPKPTPVVDGPSVVRRKDVLGGLLHEYECAAA